MRQFNTDCLNKIFEYLDDDDIHSCLLVNRLWCQVSVRIFWEKIRNINTLMYFLPNESRNFISPPTSNPPIFNYVSFCKILSINDIRDKVENILKKQNFISSHGFSDNVHKLVQEICKLLMSQAPSLKKLVHLKTSFDMIKFNFYPGAENRLKNLSELWCNSRISSKFFIQLSNISHNIRLLHIEFKEDLSNELKNLISVQKNLKYVHILTNERNLHLKIDFIIKELPDTLTELTIGVKNNISLSAISRFINLQKLIIMFTTRINEDKLIKLRDVVFPKLQVLKLLFKGLNYNFITNFLENNGKNLKELMMDECEGKGSLYLVIAEFCKNLRKLSFMPKNDELQTMKIVFDNLQYLESIQFCCGGNYLSDLNEKEALEIFVKYSHHNVRELRLHYQGFIMEKLTPKELESLLKSLTNHVPQRSFSLIITRKLRNLEENAKNMEIIEKYIKLGIIKEFRVIYNPLVELFPIDLKNNKKDSFYKIFLYSLQS
ncbi:unnamed protein product [Rhizophagus irregularis]|uniref:F-box domain-containing protein n=1 Tax=Rhizophagus irregularis TaxID=588596 RepID=A0A2I1FW26_9GLOM|nr:hypothetical protein RhiirA4_451524 [Rhizophagus irregularis]CAB4429305.1 unnamed protein product [Rhizophagus irregularis]